MWRRIALSHTRPPLIFGLTPMHLEMGRASNNNPNDRYDRIDRIPCLMTKFALLWLRLNHTTQPNN